MIFDLLLNMLMACEFAMVFVLVHRNKDCTRRLRKIVWHSCYWNDQTELQAFGLQECRSRKEELQCVGVLILT